QEGAASLRLRGLRDVLREAPGQRGGPTGRRPRRRPGPGHRDEDGPQRDAASQARREGVLMTFRPMLAVEASIEDIRFPVLASPKLDGIRATMVDGKALTRSLKPIPNHHVRMWLEANCPNGWDGELMLPRRADGTLPDFNEVQS